MWGLEEWALLAAGNVGAGRVDIISSRECGDWKSGHY